MKLPLPAWLVMLVAACGLAQAFQTFVAPDSSLWQVSLLDARLLAVVGCTLAASLYTKSQSLFWAWVVLGASEFLLLNGDTLVAGAAVAAAGDTARVVRQVLLVAANFAYVIGVVFFSRALSSAGLDLIGSRRSRFLTQVILSLVAFAFVARGLWVSVQGTIEGDPSARVRLISDLGDLAGFVVLAPMLYTAATLKGGRLGWTYAFLACINGIWIIYDGYSALSDWLGVPTAPAIENALRLMASLFTFAAGLTQRWVVQARDS